MPSSQPSITDPPTPALAAEMAAWVARERAFNAARTQQELQAAAEAIAHEPSPFAEVHALQCSLLLRAWPLLRGSKAQPRARASMPAASRVAWARLSLLVEPTGCAELLDRSIPWHALLGGLDLLSAPAPMEVIRALLASNDEEPRKAALLALPGAVQAGHGSMSEGQALLVRALSDDAPALREAALRELSAPWALSLPVPVERLVPILQGADDDEALLAIEAAGARGMLAAVKLAPAGAGERRRAALRWVGKLGEREVIEEILLEANDSPAELGAAALAALKTMQHRGLFVRPDQAPLVLSLLSAGVPFEADDVAGVLFVARRSIVERLSALEVDDPDWLFLMPLLAAWARGPRPPPGMIDQLLRVGAGARRPALAASALRLLQGLALDLADFPREQAEALALGRLGSFFEDSVELLDIVGGEATRLSLLSRSGWGPEGACDEALAPRIRRVFWSIWMLSTDEQREELLRRARPSWLTGKVQASLARPAPARRRAWFALQGGHEDPESCLVALAEVAEPDDLGEIALWTRRALEQALARPWRSSPGERWPDPWLGEQEKRFRGGEEAWQLADRCVEALSSMEARWRARHGRPSWLLSSGKRLVAELMMGLLEGEGDQALRAGALRTLLSLDHPRLPARAAELILSDDPDVVKLGARALARRGARWLSLELRRKIDEGDERVVRACLEALAAEAAPGAEEAALQALSHRNMNIKKTGAEILGQVGTAASAPALLRWLGQHDNPGFRAALTSGLRKALGKGYYLAGVLAAVHAADEPRRRRLLIEALDRELTPTLLRRMRWRSPNLAAELLSALASGSIGLASGSLSELGPELVDAGLSPAPRRAVEAEAGEPGRPSPWQQAVEALYFEGWSPERASAALALWPDHLSSADVEKLRIFLRQWLDRMIAHGEGRPLALLRAVIEAPRLAEGELIDREKQSIFGAFAAAPRGRRSEYFGLLEALSPRLSAAERLSLGELLREHLGDMPGLGRSPLGLLRRCGLLVDRRDVVKALSGVGSVKNPAQVRRDILAEAFGEQGAPLPERVRLAKVPWVEPQKSEGWGEALSEALRAHGPGLLNELREQWIIAPDTTLRALIHELPAAWPTESVRDVALDWMEALRPVGASGWGWPAWPRPTPSPREPVVAPALLDHQARLEQACAWLREGEGARCPAAEVFDQMTPQELEAALKNATDGRLSAVHRQSFPPAARAQAWVHLEARWERLPAGMRAELRSHRGRGASEPGWVDEGWGERERELRRRLMTEPIDNPNRAPEDAGPDDVARWLAEARGHDAEAARVALTRLSGRPVEGWRGLLLELAERGHARVRHHALRLIRKTLAQQDTLAAARWFLQDDDPSARRMAVRIVCHGRDPEALPAVVGLLLDPISWVRDEALAGLRLMPEEAAPLVRRARDRARPDEARRLDEALARLLAPNP